MNATANETRSRVLELWAANVPATEIAYRCRVSAPTVRNIAKRAGVYPRTSDAERMFHAKTFAEAIVTPEEAEQRRAEVEASWSEQERRLHDVYRHQTRVRIRTYRAAGHGLEEVA